MAYFFKFFLFLCSFILALESLANPFCASIIYCQKTNIIKVEGNIISINDCKQIADEIKKLPNFVKFIKNRDGKHSKIDHLHLDDVHYHFKFDSKVTPDLLNQVLSIIKVRQRVLTETIKEYEKYLQSLESEPCPRL